MTPNVLRVETLKGYDYKRPVTIFTYVIPKPVVIRMTSFFTSFHGSAPEQAHNSAELAVVI